MYPVGRIEGPARELLKMSPKTYRSTKFFGRSELRLVLIDLDIISEKSIPMKASHLPTLDLTQRRGMNQSMNKQG